MSRSKMALELECMLVGLLGIELGERFPARRPVLSGLMTCELGLVDRPGGERVEWACGAGESEMLGFPVMM